MPPSVERPPTRALAFGDACYAVNLQIRPPDATRARLAALRERMAAATGRAMRFAPAETLHLTVISVAYGRALYAMPPEAVWARLERPVDAALRALAGSIAPFALDFVRAGLRGDAVVAEADPDPRLEAIRDGVATAMAGIAPVFRTPTTHSTVARLTEPVTEPLFGPLAAWLDTPAIEWPVSELRLVVETRYPALEEAVVGRFPLDGG